MPSSSTGKWVSRAGSTGSSRTYRGKTPVNWYAALVVIVLLGLFSVGFARYEYRQSPSSTPSAHPWYAGLSMDRCGTVEPVLPASTSKSTEVYTPGEGVITISLADRSEATLGRFFDGYPTATLTQTTFTYPGTTVLRNGDACPKGTPDAGKKGVVEVYHWNNFSEKTGTKVTGDPTVLPLTNGELVTAAFVPAGSKVAKPPKTTIEAVLSAIAGSPPTTTTTSAATTTTTSAATTTTTSAATTTTTSAATTTTTSAATTTTSAATTTTTKGSSTTSTTKK